MGEGVKGLVMMTLALGALAASAFNKNVWLEQRNQVKVEAARMSQDYAKYAARVTEPAENVTIPVESYPDGKVKVSIFAAKAFMFLQENMVWGEDVLVREFAPDGAVTASFKAKNILVDRKRRLGWVPSNSEIEYSGTVVSGRGTYVDFADRFVSVSKSAKIASRNLKLKDAVPGKPRQVKVATITSDSADYDNQDGVILFDGRVNAKIEEYDLHAERVYVFLEGTNQLRRIVAEGGVTLTNGTKIASASQAVFNREEAKLVMFGDGKQPARLQEDGGRKGNVEGSRIVYWTDSEQIEVSDSKITVEASAIRGGQLKKALGGGTASKKKTAKKAKTAKTGKPIKAPAAEKPSAAGKASKTEGSK